MYSLDFRERVFSIQKREALTFKETSERFGVGMRTLFAWKKRIEPCLKRNKPATKIDMEKLRNDVEENPDDYQYERAKRFGVSAWGIGLALRRLNVSHKKNSVSSQGRRSKKTRVHKNDRSVQTSKKTNRIS